MRFLPLLPLLLLAASDRPSDQDSSERFLLSLRIELQPGEQLERFAIDTWGVDILAVCNVPPGWRVTAGRSAAPDGVINGEGTHGVTWIGAADLDRLNGLALVQLYGPVQPDPIYFDPPSSGEVPATFGGEADVMGRGGRTTPLTSANVRLTSAERCPPPAR